MGIKETWGANLKIAREKKGWSQAKTANEIGVDTRTLRRWESGDTSEPLPLYKKAIKKVFKEDIFI